MCRRQCQRLYRKVDPATNKPTSHTLLTGRQELFFAATKFSNLKALVVHRTEFRRQIE